jgi:hypothetical protein
VVDGAEDDVEESHTADWHMRLRKNTRQQLNKCMPLGAFLMPDKSLLKKETAFKNATRCG